MAADLVDCDRELESVVPTVNCEAEETDRAVQSLASELRATVEVYYVSGGGMAAKARRLACTEATIYARLNRARRLVMSWLSDRASAREAERARVVRLTAFAAPPRD